jgi:hypothetical protein
MLVRRLQLDEIESDPTVKGASHMSESPDVQSTECQERDTVMQEIGRLLGLVKRLEHENASLRRELAAARPLAA